MAGTASRPCLAKARLMRAGYAAVLLIPITACCTRVKPDQPAAEPQAVATPAPAAERAAAPPPAQPVPPPPPAAPTPKPQAGAEPGEAAAPERDAAAVPAPSVETPTQQTAAGPAASAPLPSKPATAPAPTSQAPAPRAPAKPAAPVPSATRPVAPPLPGPPTPQTADKGVVPATKATEAAPALDLNKLKQGLKDTKAIGLFTKITLKNQMDDLLDWFDEYHRGLRKRSLTDLRRSYDLLVMKALSLVQDDDRRLASDILSSRETIWALLMDPMKFAELQV